MRLTKEIVQQRLDADGRGLTIVGAFTKAIDKSDFSCSSGHSFNSAVHSVLAGTGCPVCARESIRLKKTQGLDVVRERIRALGTGIELVSGFVNVASPAVFRCLQGHEWRTTVSSIVNGKTGCSRCAGIAQLTKEVVNSQIAHTGLVLLGEYPGIVTAKCKFVCEKGHVWESTVDNVRQRSGCPSCMKLERASEFESDKEKFNKQLAPRGIAIVGDFSGLKRGKDTFACSFGHLWTTSLDSVLRKTGCPTCSGCVQLTRETINNRLAPRGISMICEYKGNANIKHRFSCASGHEWDAKPGSVLHKDGCAVCGGNARHTTEELNEKLIGRGIQLSGPYIGNNKDQQSFLCDKGHEWAAKTGNVLKGSGCPVCSYGGFKPGKPGVLYFLEVDHYTLRAPVYKVGITNGDVAERVSKMGATKGTEIKVKRCIEFSSGFAARDMERELHKKFAGYRYKGDVKLIANGHTELFTVDISKLI
jgi:hypothetical protein